MQANRETLLTSAPMSAQVAWPTLLGQGNAWIVGLPSDFNLGDKLKNVSEIRLATAFARRSGWKYFRNIASQGPSKMFLLTGLDCWHTEPELLKEWYELAMSAPSRIEAKIAPKDIFFHPKVLITTSANNEGDFAIVGSGNLSGGGLCHNVECGVYVENQNLISQLRKWFDKQFERSSRLTDEGVALYAKSCRKNSKSRKKLEEQELDLRTQIDEYASAKMDEWDRAVKEAKTFFATSDFERSRKNRRKAAEDIQDALKSPQFNFDARGLDKFFAIWSLGRLRAGQKPKISGCLRRFQEGLRALIVDPEVALPKILEPNGMYKIPGSSLNTISKILACHEPASWPVLNRKVKDVLRDFGYRAPRGATTTNQYLAYRDLMKKFSAACGRKMDAFELDAFFVDCWKRSKK